MKWAQSVKTFVSHVKHHKVSITEETQNNQVNKITLWVDAINSLLLTTPQCWQKKHMNEVAPVGELEVVHKPNNVHSHSGSDVASATCH